MDAREKAAEVAREVAGVSQCTTYAWKAKYGGMNVSEIQEAKQLRDENARLRKLVANPLPAHGPEQRIAREAD